MAEEEDEPKKVPGSRKPTDVHRYKIDKLMKNPDKPVYIPEAKETKLPRVFRPPEFIRNIWGSSAGVGSGDFHIYRNMRRRQNAREKHMNLMSEQDRLDEEFQERMEQKQIACEDKTNKKRQKRLKKKQKQRAKKPKQSEEQEESESESEEEEEDENEPVTEPNTEPNTQTDPTNESDKQDNTEKNDPAISIALNKDTLETQDTNKETDTQPNTQNENVTNSQSSSGDDKGKTERKSDVG